MLCTNAMSQMHTKSSQHRFPVSEPKLSVYLMRPQILSISYTRLILLEYNRLRIAKYVVTPTTQYAKRKHNS